VPIMDLFIPIMDLLAFGNVLHLSRFLISPLISNKVEEFYHE
jgi:hypothetical protein